MATVTSSCLQSCSFGESSLSILNLKREEQAMMTSCARRSGNEMHEWMQGE